MNFDPRTQAFVDAGVLTPGDVHTITLAARRFGDQPLDALLGLAFALRAPREGHAGVDLTTVAGTIDDERLRPISDAGAPTEEADPGESASIENDVPAPGAVALPWPDPQRWLADTLASALVGDPGDATHGDRPFVRQETEGRTLLLTRRMYDEQQWVAARLRTLMNQPVPAGKEVPGLDARLKALFPDDSDGESAQAVRLAAENSLAIVIGGPGTGKTFSITRLLAALLESRPEGEPFVIRLGAPTGKAAARMKEAIREALAPDAKVPLVAAPGVRDALQALDASTLHRIVGMRPDGTSRHAPDNPITADIVVVDEVSMVDLALMRRLLDAVGKETRLVLLGDRDQLASVEAGCVLADLVGDGRRGPLARHVRTFTRSRRFAAAPDIALIAACLQSYDTKMDDVPTDPSHRLSRALEVFAGDFHARTEKRERNRVTRLGAPAGTRPGGAARPSDDQLEQLAAPYIQGIDTFDQEGRPLHLPGYASLLANEVDDGTFSKGSLEPAFQRRLLGVLDQYRVLAVHRRGLLGVRGLENAIAQRVRAFLMARGISIGGRHWIGRPILVTENAYDVGLMNGDVGLVLPTRQGPAAVFPDEQPSEVRIVALSRLPPHEGALAMTVHKSQGSQFDRVALVLAGRDSAIQTRELVYTGVTRAKDQLAWLGTHDELAKALGRVVERASGLRQLIT